MALPVVVLTLVEEDQAVAMELALPEHMDVLLRAVGDGLDIVVLPSGCDGAEVFDDGVVEVTHGVLLISYGLRRR